VLVTLLAAAGWVFSLQSLKGLPPLLFMGLRFAAAGLVVGAFVRREAWPAARQLAITAAIGLVMAVTMLCWILGLHWVSNVGVGAFICRLGMVFAPLLGWLMFRQHVSSQTWAGTAIAMIGLGFLTLQHGFHVSLSDLLFFASACGLALQFNLNARYATRIPVLPSTAIQLGMVGICCLLASAGFERWPAMPAADVIGWFMASVLIATSLRFFLLLKAQSLGSASHSALILTLEPVWTAIVVAAWRGERMSASQLIGCLLIFGALFVCRWPRSLRPQRAPA
jgi:drug/metabolite transporter (DMT)-like permease